MYFAFFLQENGKNYENDVIEQHRFETWKANLALVTEHNRDSEKHGYTLEMNHLADLTAAEVVELYNGYKMRPVTNSTKTFVYDPNLKIPEEKDWRKDGAVTPVKNQGQCGSCWAFSTTGSLEGQHFLKDRSLVSLSEQNLMDCSKPEGNHGCKGGLMDLAFKYIIRNHGIDTEMSYPYQAHDELCRFRMANVGATMTSFKDIPKDNVEALTEAVATIGPISVAMDASRPTFHLYKQGVYKDRGCSSTKLDHGVLAVGYGTYEGEDYFLVKNSWGTRWGMEGYFMIERSFTNMCGLATQASYPII